MSGSGLVRIRDRVHVRVVSGSCPWFAFGLRLGSGSYIGRVWLVSSSYLFYIWLVFILTLGLSIGLRKLNLKYVLRHIGSSSVSISSKIIICVVFFRFFKN